MVQVLIDIYREVINMRLGNHHILKKLMLTTDFMNTTNGGMAMVNNNVNQEKDAYISHMKIPWSNPDNMKIQIIDNRIYIYSIMDFGENGGYDGIKRLPYTLEILDVPYDVNIKGISASYFEGVLKIILPFNELAGGFRREISIDKS